VYQMLERVQLAGPTVELQKRRVLLVITITWLPLSFLSAITGHLLGGQGLPFLRDIETHVRFLIALPVLVMAELVVHLAQHHRRPSGRSSCLRLQERRAGCRSPANRCSSSGLSNLYPYRPQDSPGPQLLTILLIGGYENFQRGESLASLFCDLLVSRCLNAQSRVHERAN
jgi:hypothetical protein